MKNNENLKILKELTNSLTSFESITKVKGKGFIELELINGTALSWNLLHEKDLAIDKWFISKGSTFQEHTHNVKEMFTIYQGTMILKIENEKEVKLKKGDSYYVLPNVKHSSFCPEDCFFITITIPSMAKGF